MPQLSQLYRVCWQPRETVREIVASPAGRWTEALAITAVIADDLVSTDVSSPDWSAQLFQNLHFWAIVPTAVIPLYLVSALVYWVAARLGGRASYEQVRITYAWSSAPQIILLIPLSLLVLLFAPDAMSELACLAVPLAIWSTILWIVALAEVSGFSKKKALATLLASTIAIVLALLLVGTVVAIVWAVLYAAQST